MIVAHKGTHRHVVFIPAKQVGHPNQAEQVILIVDALDMISSNEVIKSSNGKA
uniref:hypothetical protein n=1 Tax=Algoriphagus sp. TaxID=1872435 RepID=UPI0040479831